MKAALLFLLVMIGGAAILFLLQLLPRWIQWSLIGLLVILMFCLPTRISSPIPTLLLIAVLIVLEAISTALP